MGGAAKPAGRDAVIVAALELVSALAPIAIILAIQHRDDLARWKMRAERMLGHYPGVDTEALQQVQKEISLMEHGEYGGADAS